MSRSRCTLHKSKLGDFTQWLLARGWNVEVPKGDYEVLRMRLANDYKTILLVYDRNNAKEHYTTFGVGDRMMRKWLRERNE